MSDKEILPVVQGVREAAAGFMRQERRPESAHLIETGKWDKGPLVQAFASIRERTIEECARVAEQQPMITDTDEWDGYKAAQKDIATAIRSLASPPSVEDKA